MRAASDQAVEDFALWMAKTRMKDEEFLAKRGAVGHRPTTTEKQYKQAFKALLLEED